jgi:hypothetical protein
MRRSIITLLCCLLVFVPCRGVYGTVINLSENDVADAVTLGKEQGTKVIKYLKQHYRFGKEGTFEVQGIIRTKWSKLAMLAGLLIATDKELTETDKERILENTNLQIDIYTFGDTIEFAKEYKSHLVQNDTIVHPEKVSANHVTYLPGRRAVASGFPKYRATVRSYFSYEGINPNNKARIVLVKDKEEVVFEINFANYR